MESSLHQSGKSFFRLLKKSYFNNRVLFLGAYTEKHKNFL